MTLSPFKVRLHMKKLFQLNYHFSKECAYFFAFALHFFSENVGNVRDEHDERFHQEMNTIGQRYQRFCDQLMMENLILFATQAMTATRAWLY